MPPKKIYTQRTLNQNYLAKLNFPSMLSHLKEKYYSEIKCYFILGALVRGFILCKWIIRQPDCAVDAAVIFSHSYCPTELIKKIASSKDYGLDWPLTKHLFFRCLLSFNFDYVGR